ncbi:unnamed protein product [Arabis nemorensis]|uniref:Uncharacterized protein n=1 Tax=Arabis nemorensis TaxID=586526 RepID=A0A565BHI7_9BRAS|nr:unnamed protein product [Arabis nemorensis]
MELPRNSKENHRDKFEFDHRLRELASRNHTYQLPRIEDKHYSELESNRDSVRAFHNGENGPAAFREPGEVSPNRIPSNNKDNTEQSKNYSKRPIFERLSVDGEAELELEGSTNTRSVSKRPALERISLLENRRAQEDAQNQRTRTSPALKQSSKEQGTVGNTPSQNRDTRAREIQAESDDHCNSSPSSEATIPDLPRMRVHSGPVMTLPLSARLGQRREPKRTVSVQRMQVRRRIPNKKLWLREEGVKVYSLELL